NVDGGNWMSRPMASGSMRAIHFTGKGSAILADLSIGAIPPGHALIRVKASGLCHTGIDVLHARYGDGAFPRVPAHGSAGEVQAAAAAVTRFQTGDRVAVDPNRPCGTCDACRKGLTHLCRDLKAYGVSHDGGFAEYSLVHTGNLHGTGDMPYH